MVDSMTTSPDVVCSGPSVASAPLMFWWAEAGKMSVMVSSWLVITVFAPSTEVVQ